MNSELGDETKEYGYVEIHGVTINYKSQKSSCTLLSTRAF